MKTLLKVRMLIFITNMIKVHNLSSKADFECHMYQYPTELQYYFWHHKRL